MKGKEGNEYKEWRESRGKEVRKEGRQGRGVGIKGGRGKKSPLGWNSRNEGARNKERSKRKKLQITEICFNNRKEGIVYFPSD